MIRKHSWTCFWLRPRLARLAIVACCFHATCNGGRSHMNPRDTPNAKAMPVRHRCRGTKGTWCLDFLVQQPVDWKAPPRHGKNCPSGCRGAGNCMANIGVCDCPAGWTGGDCMERQRRPCTNRWRDSPANPEPTSSYSLSDKGWTASRCAGICDEDTGLCFCNGTMGRVAPPPGSLPGASPTKEGRPMIEAHCAPKTDDKGEPSYGKTSAEDLYGSNGWCEASEPNQVCACVLDGLAGPLCEERTEMFCVNQCSGNGECRRGWCQCHEGYFGTDCAHMREGAAENQGTWHERPALRDFIRTPAAEDPSPEPSRARPLIYIYDLPAIYNSRMLQYRSGKEMCTYRAFQEGNVSSLTSWTYAIETGFHELLAQSPHRTLDPEEADFFYAPVYTACYAHPIYGWADFPWFYGIGGPRTAQMSNMLLQGKQWLQQSHPFWNRTGGKDHIFLSPHDEGSCWVPEELRPAIILSHWGRKDSNHTSNTAYPPDNYSKEWTVPELSPLPWNHILGQEVPCYIPGKDLVIPALRPPQLLESPLIGSPARERKMLAFFRGDFRDEHSPEYSRGLRQKLRRLAREHAWATRYGIYIGDRSEIDGSYESLFTQSIFCLVLPGDGYSSRAGDSILNGCLPVVVMDSVDAAFESILDWNLFSIRIKEEEVDQLPSILLSISEAEIVSMQHALSHVWHRFAYTSLPLWQKIIGTLVEENRHRHHEAPLSLPGPQFGNLQKDDAFSTIMAWLYSRIQDTRPSPPKSADWG